MYRILLICLVLTVIPCRVAADGKRYFKYNAGPDYPYEHELKYLPDYCACVSGKYKERYIQKKQKWKRYFKSKGNRGSDWIHLHHYCFGLTAMSRLRRGLGNRDHLMARAEGEFNYVIKQSSSRFVLMPEIQTNMGIVKLMQQKYVEAVLHFIRAIKLNKNYKPAYSYLIEYYKSQDKIKEAKKIASIGLQNNPDSEYFKEILSNLGR